jgi:plastocyanin
LPSRLFAFTTLFASIVVSVAAAATMTVDQHGLKFTKSSASLAKGDVLIFANGDDVTHNIHVFKDDVDDKDLGLQKPGVPLNYKFDKVGRFVVRCNIHPAMKMVVTVK